MPRFSIKALLVGFALIAIWLSTYAGYPLSNDVRTAIMLLVFLTAGLSALFSRGRRQAFWLGFFAVMLVMGIGYPSEYTPRFGAINKWMIRFNSSDADRDRFYFIRDSVQSLIVVCLSIVIGAIGAYIYDQNRQPPTK